MFKKVITFFKEVKQELSRVSWPNRRELWASTGIVIVVSMIFAGVIWVMDIIFNRLFFVLFG
ncbi:preprotein translocase subunit SecE [candidate division WOR-3 bacterium]|nr:preprotein translocase subunit SecE [candidate division WOR-3 bacterium]MCK4527914.1 preprotein translocase subunit SecE [candidate division WOR-3 bacterium]